MPQALGMNSFLKSKTVSEATVKKFAKKLEKNLSEVTNSYPKLLEDIEKVLRDCLPTKIKEFNEISWGVNQGKSDDLEDYARLIDTWLAGNLDNKFEEGESPNEMSVRLVKGFNKVLDDDHDTVLLCIHGRALRILLSKIIDNDLTKMDKYVHSNTGLYILEYKNGKYEILGSDQRDHLE